MDSTAHGQIEAAEERDARADDRDVAALARDQAAAARDLAVAQADVLDALEDDAHAAMGEQSVIRAQRRRRAAEQHARATEQRLLAAEDRLAAERDREQAALERRRSLVDREMLVRERERAQQREEEALRHQRRAEKLARTLQRTLSPPRLPHIAGLDVAVHYEPFAPEEVGGDFYDLFPLAAGRSGFFLGDVCGKGPEAAAVTSLARYTMRTAAMLHERPDEILLDLNAALLMEGAESMQTCTAVYGEIVMGRRAAAITLAAAGHPAPLIVRADATVETSSARGTILGAARNPAFHTCEITLDPGDAVVIYSDGILDTQIDRILVDEQRVETLLSGSAHSTAQAHVDRLMHALRRIDRPLRDDVAIMALRRVPS